MKKLTIGLFSLLAFTLCAFLSSSAFAARPQPGAPMMHAPWMSGPPAYRAQMARMAARRYDAARHPGTNPKIAWRSPWIGSPEPMIRPTQGVWRQAAARPPMWQSRPQQRRSMAPRQRIVAWAPAAYYGQPMWRQAQRPPMRAQRAPVPYSPSQMMAQRARMQGFSPMYRAQRPMYRGPHHYTQAPAPGTYYQRPMMARQAAARITYRTTPRTRWNFANSQHKTTSVPPTQISSLGMAMIPRTLR